MFRITTDKLLDRIEIFDLTGRAVNCTLEDGNNEINLSREADGVYMLRAVLQDGNVKTIRLVKG